MSIRWSSPWSIRLQESDEYPEWGMRWQLCAAMLQRSAITVMASAVRLLPLALLGSLSTAAFPATTPNTLSLQGVSFQAKTTSRGFVQQLVVNASEHGHADPVVKQELDG